MIGNSNYIGTSLYELTQEVKSKGKNPSQFLQFVFMNKGDRTSLWVGTLKTKRIRYQWFLWKKTDDWGYGSCNDWINFKKSNTDNLAVTEESHADETVNK